MVTTDTTSTTVFLLGLFLALVGAGIFLATNTQFCKFAAGSLIWSGALLALAGSLAISNTVFAVFSVIILIGIFSYSAFRGWRMYKRFTPSSTDGGWADQALFLSIIGGALGGLNFRLSGMDWPRVVISSIAVFIVVVIFVAVFTGLGKYLAQQSFERSLRRRLR